MLDLLICKELFYEVYIVIFYATSLKICEFQEVLLFLNKLVQDIGIDVTVDQMKEYCINTLKTGVSISL